MAFRSVVTPEAVELRTRIAGIGSRFVAAVLDGVIQGAVLLALFFIVASGGPGDGAVVAFIVIAIAVTYGYAPLFEIVWSGQTPGKRAQGIRVVRSDGSPITIGAALLRNLFRLIDMLPTMYAIGVITMLVDGQSRRVGDIVAGTLVVHESKPIRPSTVSVSSDAAAAASAIDASGLDHRDYSTIRSYLDRRDKLDPQARAALASTIAAAVRARVSITQQMSDDALLEAVAHAYRMRFGG